MCCIYTCCFVQHSQVGDLQVALETAVLTDNFSHIIKDNPSLWLNLPRAHSKAENGKNKTSVCEQMSPVEFGQQESKQQQKKKRGGEMKAHARDCCR